MQNTRACPARKPSALATPTRLTPREEAVQTDALAVRAAAHQIHVARRCRAIYARPVFRLAGAAVAATRAVPALVDSVGDALLTPIEGLATPTVATLATPAAR